MLNYIKAELYRNFHRKYIWIYTGIFTVLAVLINVILKAKGSVNVGLGNMFQNTIEMFGVAIFLLLPIIDMTTAEEHKNNTMKNTISLGLSRNSFVISKIIVSIILTLMWAVIIYFAYFTSGILLFGVGKGPFSPYIIKILVAIPLYIAVISIGTFIALSISNNSIFAFVYAGIFVIIPVLFKILIKVVSVKFEKVFNILISQQLANLKNTLTSNTICTAIISGFIYILVFLSLSLIFFNKKEIK